MTFQEEILEGIPDQLPKPPQLSDHIPRAPRRKDMLTLPEKKLAITNALRYFPPTWHETLAVEFYEELKTYGRIYMYRFMPQHAIYARAITEYPGQSVVAKAIMLMIQNNLDPQVAQHPYELITYGGNGAVFQNWVQYRLTLQYLAQMTDEQTLVMNSGHPQGLFPSSSAAPRVVISNGMMIPNHSTNENHEKGNALGVTQYGQMTAGSYMYIGPQGIVHGTAITLLNAVRKIGGQPEGKLFVTAGLGGMSGAQPKAGNIAGLVSLIAEVDEKAARKRHDQGWVDELSHDVDEAIDKALHYRKMGQARAIAFIGNVVHLWERLVERSVKVDLGSDQTSLHNPWAGGYYPVSLDFGTARDLMAAHPKKFKEAVQESLCRHALAINQLAAQGMYFFDYGNAFLLEAARAGAQVMSADGLTFRYPSYVEDIMGPMCFDYGFGPFRWVCASGKPEDLAYSDLLAAKVIEELMVHAPEEIQQQLSDNLKWIKEAGNNQMVVGSQARILYADAQGRIEIAKAFNKAIAKGKIGTIILGRDHHDVSGTDSPYRETANIYDGSKFTADMAVQNFVGDAFRGASWVSLHNGGGVGWGEAINGGFGLVLDGSSEVENKLEQMLFWDVNNGISRRSWARNPNAIRTIERTMQQETRLKVTIPQLVGQDLWNKLNLFSEEN